MNLNASSCSIFITLLSPLQEIYPPKIYEFAYVTDGACDMWDIQQTELHMLKVRVCALPPSLYLPTHLCRCAHLYVFGVVLQALDWNLCPETPISWLKLYAQVDAQTDGENFLVPQFSQEMYIQITQVRHTPETPSNTQTVNVTGCC